MSALADCRVLVTGGAGFIGSSLIAELARNGADIRIVDNLVNGRHGNVTPQLGDRCKLSVLDIRDTERMAELLVGTDVVFHLACLGVRHSIHSPLENHDVNATATLHLLELARRARVARFVYVSSSEVYGTARTVPMTEDHPTLPMTVYGAAKLAGEAYARAYHRTYGLETVVVRPFNSYGPRCHHEGDCGEVIPKFILRCMAGQPLIVFGDGKQTRDFTYVEDTARGIAAAGVAPDAAGETINLGQGGEMDILTVARKVSEAIGAAAEIRHDAPRPGDVLRLYADIGKARDVLSFSPRVSFEDGLRKLVAWYTEQGTAAADLLADERVHNWSAT